MMRVSSWSSVMGMSAASSRAKCGGVGRTGSGHVVGHDAHGDAAGMGGDQGVTHGNALEVVDGGVDGSDGGRGGDGDQVGGEIDGRVWWQAR